MGLCGKKVKTYNLRREVYILLDSTEKKPCDFIFYVWFFKVMQITLMSYRNNSDRTFFYLSEKFLVVNATNPPFTSGLRVKGGKGAKLTSFQSRERR